MITFRRHRPAYVDGHEIRNEMYKTFQDLLEDDYLQRWASDKNFSHFAKSGNLIMCILNDGFSWWVMGRVEEEDQIDLPEWEGGKYNATLADGTETVLTKKEVSGSTGNTLFLHDGTRATWRRL